MPEHVNGAAVPHRAGALRDSTAATTGGMLATYGFTRQREDTQAPGSSGLDYFGARYYDPAVGRFTSADSVLSGLGDPLGLDTYSYVGGHVTIATDPSGHECTGGCEIGGDPGGWGSDGTVTAAPEIPPSGANPSEGRPQGAGTGQSPA